MSVSCKEGLQVEQSISHSMLRSAPARGGTEHVVGFQKIWIVPEIRVPLILVPLVNPCRNIIYNQKGPRTLSTRHLDALLMARHPLGQPFSKP